MLTFRDLETLCTSRITMHEYSVAEGIVNILKGVAAQHGSKVRLATVAVGPFSMIVPELLQEAWIYTTKGTELEGAELEIEPVPVVAKCQECGHETKSFTPFVRCEACGSLKLSLQSGHELQVISAELDDKEEEVNTYES